MICDQCKGKRYPFQCRNSAAWRDRYGAPSGCPHGLPLGYSPDGVKRGDYGRPARRGPHATPQATPKALPLCRHAKRYTEGCCDGWKVLCRHPRHMDHRRLKACRSCPDYEHKEG